MTAAELFEIVKDVPREAWPSMVVFVANMWAFETKAWPTGTKSHFMPTEVAEHAFIGSMTAWLAGKSLGCMEMKHQSHENSEMRFTVTINLGWTERGYEHVELVAALAAACKEAN